MFTHRFSLVTFRVRDPNTKKASNELSEIVMHKIHNTEKGYSTTGELNEYRFIRLNFGSLLSK